MQTVGTMQKNATSGHNVQKLEGGTEKKSSTVHHANSKKKYYRQQQPDTSGHNVQKSQADAEKAFLKENSFMQEEQPGDSDSTMENEVHVRDTYQRSEKKGKYHKKRVQREHAHKERAKSENRGSPTVESFRRRMILLRRGRQKDLRIRGYRRLLTNRRRTAGSYRRQRIRCRRSGSMR